MTSQPPIGSPLEGEDGQLRDELFYSPSPTQARGSAVREEDVKERPILFSSPMVRALLAGSKTQTRRVVKPQPNDGLGCMVHLGDAEWGWDDGDLSGLWRCPYGVPGDRLWVREAWAVKRHEPCLDHERDWQDLLGPTIRYLADDATRQIQGDRSTGVGIYRGPVEKGRPSIHMPRWASRLTLQITDVRVERLQDISEADTDAEGFGGDFPEKVMPDVFPPRDGGWGHLSLPECYGRLWEHINGPGSWGANPFVWCVSFEVARQS